MVKTEKILEELSKRYKIQLDYLDESHEKLIICFSGVPGSGKSYIAKLIEERYKGVRISTDNIRKLINEMGKDYPELLEEAKREEILHKYIYGLIEDYSFRNGLLILDKGVDRDYEKIFSVGKEKDFKIFIVRVCASRSVLTERIRTKLGELDANFVNNIDRWIMEFRDFGKNVKSDFVIDNEIDEELNTGRLFVALDEIMEYISHKHKV